MSQSTDHPKNDHSEPDQHSQESPLELNPQLIAAMMAAIREQPLSVGLSEPQLLRICEQAMLENRLHDQQWLQQALQTAHYQNGAREEHFHQAANIHPPSGEAANAPLSADQMPHAPHDGLRDHNKLNHIPVAEHQSPQTQQELDLILERHGAWIASVLHPSKDVEAGRANLKGVDLRSFDLAGCDLRGASLEGVNLEGANLSRANLSTAKLQGANLRHCNLSEAKLRRTDLTGADLEGAELDKADLSRAILEGSTLTGTLLDTTPEPDSELEAEVSSESSTDEAAMTSPPDDDLDIVIDCEPAEPSKLTRNHDQ